jgi:hypothetical protein
MKYRQFIFESYFFEPETGELKLHYSLDGALHFTEEYRFDFSFVKYNSEVLDRAFQLLFFMAGVSYYKTYLPSEIVIKSGSIDSRMAEFLSKTYQKGLGEFFFVNNLDPITPTNFPATSSEILNTLSVNGEGLIVGLGGGKDSLVSVEILREQIDNLATWSLNHRSQLTSLVDRIGLPHFWVERQWDPKLKDLAAQGAYNGHVPISAIFACVGTIVAVLTGKRDVVTSNESSANEPTLTYQGVDINHQYSKSLEFEQDFQGLLLHLFGDGLRYYSFLRPLSELKIAELFASSSFEKYKDVFSSCNRAYVQSSDRMSWCGKCPKCAFTFLALTPFVEREKLETLWDRKNLLLDPSLEPTYRQLLGIEGNKPLECVGEIKESRAAMRLAQEQYSQLNKYSFDLPESYSWRNLSQQSMPEEIYDILQASLKNLQTTHKADRAK